MQYGTHTWLIVNTYIVQSYLKPGQGAFPWPLSLSVAWVLSDPSFKIYFVVVWHGDVGPLKERWQHATQPNLGSLTGSCCWWGLTQKATRRSAQLFCRFCLLLSCRCWVWMVLQDSSTDHLPFLVSLSRHPMSVSLITYHIHLLPVSHVKTERLLEALSLLCSLWNLLR